MSDLRSPWQPGQSLDAPRPIIAESWQRSAAYGIERDARPLTLRRIASHDLAHRLLANAELIERSRPHLEWLSAMHAAVPHVVSLVDNRGIVLASTGVDLEALDAAHLVPGCDWSEESAGTNALGTSLIAGEALAVHGPEHVAQALHGCSSAGAPVRSPAGKVIAAIAIRIDDTHVPSERLLAVAYAAYAIEQELRYHDGQRRATRQMEAEHRLLEERARWLATLEALRASEARYERIAADVPGVVYQFVYRADGTKGYTFVSEGARTLFGIAPDDVLRDPAVMLDLIHPDDRAEFYAQARAVAVTLEPFLWEGRAVLPSGEERFIQVAARDQRQPDGSVTSDGLVMDVTELHRATQRLEESEQRYRSLFDHHPDAVFSIGPDGCLLTANPACETISGYALDELHGAPFAPLVAPEHLESAVEHFNAALAGTAQSYEVVIRHKTGRQVEIDVTNIPMIVGEKVVGVFGIARDLTARRALEAQLRQAQRMEAVGQLAGGIAHDFNNILAAINGFGELLRESLEPDDPHQADVAEILKGTRRAAALTRQLLAFSRRQVLQPDVIDLNRVVADMSAMLRPLLGSAIHLARLPAPPAVSVFADRAQIEQVLMNLALNARDAMPSGGTLTIETRVTPGEAGTPPAAVLIVSDTGVGMSPEIMARAFEPFFTTKPPGRGTGLGLATVHGIVEQSGGTIDVASHEGSGTTFTITLPIAEATTSTVEPEAAARPSHGTGTVLLVEDEDAVRAIARRILERAGYHVLTARHGADALQVLAEAATHIDVLLSDVVMPELGGIELASQVIERLPELRIILMSGYTDDIGILDEHESIAAFLSKPFTADSLLDAVQHAMHAA